MEDARGFEVVELLSLESLTSVRRASLTASSVGLRHRAAMRASILSAAMRADLVMAWTLWSSPQSFWLYFIFVFVCEFCKLIVYEIVTKA